MKITQELAGLSKEIKDFEELEIEFELLKDSGEKEIAEYDKKLKEKELRLFLSGKYDPRDAILIISAGAGGRDSQDWAAMLQRMYERYCQRKCFKFYVLHQSFGEAGGPEGRLGIKSITSEVKGGFAYGFLKRESGVHRLVRISPFSPKSLRHTSFALVEVLPKIEISETGLNIRPDDLKTDVFKASGHGGQNVNKRMTAIRLTHLPTGIQAACQSERSLAQNRETAMELLTARLQLLLEEKKEKEIKKLKGEKISVRFGNQIRSYVLHPYKLIKDLRTDIETSDVGAVLDGNLDEFIQAEIKII